MENRAFGNKNVSVVGQGTWQFGRAPHAGVVAALRRGIELGMTHIDTAEMYEGAEEIVGEAIAGRRQEVFLVSKVLPSNASLSGTAAACERSLKRLRTDHLDCYLLHWPGQHRLADTIGAFARLVESGKIRSWGLSNFDVADLEAAERAGGAGQIACNQVLYHLGERAIEHAVMPWCTGRGIAVVAYSPYGSGNFPDPASSGGRVLARIADAHGATSRQVALAFLLRHAGTFVIPKAAGVAHTEDNAGASGLVLSAAEIDAVGAAFPRGRKTAHLPMI